MAKEIYQPSAAELEILNVIWELEPVSVRDIHARIAVDKNVGYTTVLKQIQRLTEKEVLDKQIIDGVHLYSSRVKERDVKEGLADKVLQTAFGGSAMEMMMHALGNRKPDDAELQALRAWLDQQIP